MLPILVLKGLSLLGMETIGNSMPYFQMHELLIGLLSQPSFTDCDRLGAYRPTARTGVIIGS